jgi:hypothetical protein
MRISELDHPYLLLIFSLGRISFDGEDQICLGQTRDDDPEVGRARLTSEEGFRAFLPVAPSPCCIQKN